MAEPELPEGTDSIISDAGMAGTGSDLGRTKALSPTADSPTDVSATRPSGVRDALKGGSDKLRATASDKAYSFLGQGIERSSAGLTNVSALIGDTATSLDERLGVQYGDYAREAAEAVERAATGLSNKNPEELVDDVRAIVRKSPGIALAGAAILGFALVRVVKSGLDASETRTSGRKSS